MTPLIISFLFAVRCYRQSLFTAVLIMAGGIVASLLITWFAECGKQSKSYSPAAILALFFFYIFLAAIFLLYFSDLFIWLNWKTDIILGLLTGLLLTLGRTYITPHLKFNPFIYGLSLCLFFPGIILSLRYSLYSANLMVMVFFGFATALFSSVLIALVEYKKIQAVDINSTGN